MPLIRRGQEEFPVESWGGYAEQQIRDARARGEFDNLPGAGKPLDLGKDTPYGAEWDLAFRMVKNAGAAPLWVELDKEIAVDTQALASMLDRSAAYVARARERLAAAPDSAPAPRPGLAADASPGHRRWSWLAAGRRSNGSGGSPSAAPTESTPAQLEAERLRARTLYLTRAAELDGKIRQFNAEKPRNLTWLEKVRLLPEAAAARFDAACPPVTAAVAAPPPDGAA